MNKNKFFMRHFKRSIALVMALVVTITLSGCSTSTDNTPTGGLTDGVYATNGTTSVSVFDIHKELMFNSLDYLNTQVTNFVFADYITKAKDALATDTDLQERLTNFVLVDIYGTSDEDELEKMKDYDKDLGMSKYIDTMYLKGIRIGTNDIKHFDDDGFQDLVDLVTDDYYDDLAKVLFAKDELDEEIKEKNDEAEDQSENYFTDRDIASYYDDNLKYVGDVSAMIVRFHNESEANAVLKKFGIKTYKGEWYQILEPKDTDGGTDLSKWSTESDYNKYYDEYEIDPTGSNADEPIKVVGNGNETILKLFIEMYNYIYTYRSEIGYAGQSSGNNTTGKAYLDQYYLVKNIMATDNGGTIEDYNDLVDSLQTTYKNVTSFSQEKMDNYSTSLTSYVNSTLRTEAEIDDETGEELDFTQYTSSARSYNNAYYIIFKMGQDEPEEFYTEEEDEDGDTVIVFADGTEDKQNEIIAELTKEALTDSYITAKANERMDDVTVSIYDPTLDYLYAKSNANYTGTKKFKNDYIASIKFGKDTLDIKVTDAYDFLEPIYAQAASINLLFDEYVKTTEEYKELNEDYNDYKDAVAVTLSNFANDAFASYGYPSSMGKYAFMQVYYRSANVDDAIYDYLMVQDAKRTIFTDLDTDFYNSIGEYAGIAYDNYYSLTLTNILVYVDMDEDGVADEDFFNDTNAFEGTLYTELANELIDDIVTKAKHSTSNLATTFTQIVDEYNSSSRIIPSTNNAAGGGTVEATWAKYRRAGLLISTNAIGEVNNITTSDDELQKLTKELYNDDDNQIMLDNKFTGAKLIDSSFYTGDYSSVNTDDGVNLILVTAGTGRTMIDVDADIDNADLYTNVPVLIKDKYKEFDVTSNSETRATASQIEVYIREYFSTGSSTSLPTSASAYLDAYLQPALTKFNSEPAQLMIMMNMMNVTSTNTDWNENYKLYLEYKQRTTDNYVSDATYAGFWTNTNLFKGNGGA